MPDIASIIAQRRPLAHRIEGVEEKLEILGTALQECERYYSSLSIHQAGSGSLGELGLSEVRRTLQIERENLAKLKARFLRDTLNIGVVGRARQGKSLLLQSLTHLTRAEIPDGDRQHCTGVRSTIYHRADIDLAEAKPTDTYAEVFFYSPPEFLSQVLQPYYQELQLGDVPKSLEAFANQPLPKLPSELQDYAEPKAKYEYLNRYRSKYAEYSSLLQQSVPLRVPRGEIRKYVAQDNLNGDRIFFNYLAVREVKIFCPFPNLSVSQIALVDMPGLGDTGIGDEARLVQALGQDVDTVLFVRLPKATGDSWFDVDVRLYDTACNALRELPLHLWSFMILNRTNADSKNGDNARNCQDFESTIHENHIQVQACLVVNCAAPKEVSTMLDTVLAYLGKQITQLDEQYAALVQGRLLQLHKTIGSELEKARQVVGDPKGSQLRKQCFNDFWDTLTYELVKFRREVQQEIGRDDPGFKAKVEEVLRKCRNDVGLPGDEEGVERGAAGVGSYSEIYARYLHQLRTDLTKHLLGLDGEIQQSLENVKLKLLRVLLNHVGLKLVSLEDQQPLQAIAHQIHGSSGGSGNLELGFQTLANFNVSFAGLIDRQLRQYLDELHPDRHLLQPARTLPVEELMAIAKLLANPSSLFESFLMQFQSPTAEQVLGFIQISMADWVELTDEQRQALFKMRPALDARQVLLLLQNAHQQTVARCEEVLTRCWKEPNHIAYAMVAEFVDLVLRSGRHRPGDVRDEWEMFLEDAGWQIWPQLRDLEQRAEQQREWLQRLERAKDANQENYYRFLERV